MRKNIYPQNVRRFVQEVQRMTAEQDKFFTTIYLSRRKPLLEYATSVLHNRAVAEEAVQQAFEIAWCKIDDFQNSPNPEGWIFNVVRFVIRNIESRQRTERPPGGSWFRIGSMD